MIHKSKISIIFIRNILNYYFIKNFIIQTKSQFKQTLSRLRSEQQLSVKSSSADYYSLLESRNKKTLNYLNEIKSKSDVSKNKLKMIFMIFNLINL